jgi:hypothetical protein
VGIGADQALVSTYVIRPLGLNAPEAKRRGAEFRPERSALPRIYSSSRPKSRKRRARVSGCNPSARRAVSGSSGVCERAVSLLSQRRTGASSRTGLLTKLTGADEGAGARSQGRATSPEGAERGRGTKPGCLRTVKPFNSTTSGLWRKRLVRYAGNISQSEAARGAV